MALDIETQLSRELRDLADGLQIPTLPPLPRTPPRGRSRWQPLLIAASVVLILAGAMAVVATTLQGGDPQPAPQPAPTPAPTATPTPTPSTSDLPSLSPTEAAEPIPTTPPTVPYVLDQRLYVEGEQVPGSWWSVTSGDEAWVGLRTDYTWWFGRGAGEPSRIDGVDDSAAPVISPNGRYVAFTSSAYGEGVLTGFDTSDGGEGLGSLPVALEGRGGGARTTVRAVTDDGRVIAQGDRANLLWLPLVVDSRPVGLQETAPGQVIRDNTPAGLVVTDGEGGEAYLATISDAGRLTRVASLPAHDDLTASPGGERLAWIPSGSLGGEVMFLPTLEVQTVDAAQQGTLKAPAGLGFRVHSWTWEDDDHLITPLMRAEYSPGERLARCSARTAECVLLPK